jgi:epoxyqueuosine reductase QueG
LKLLREGIGDIYTDLRLPADTPQAEHCGSCEKCMDILPTQAIVAPYQLDARRSSIGAGARARGMGATLKIL